MSRSPACPNPTGSPPLKSEIFHRLASIGPFSGVPRETLEEVFRGATIRRLPAAARIADQGAMPDFLDVLLEGTVELAGKGPDGREAVVQFCEPADCLLLAAVLTESPCLVGAMAVGPVRLLSIPARSVRAGAASDHRLALNLMAEQARQVRTIVRRIKNLTLRSARQRLGCYLIAQSDKAGSAGFALPVAKRQLAAQLGMTPESVSRAFAALRAYGVSVSGRTVTLRNPDLVRAECLPDPLIDRGRREPAPAAAGRAPAGRRTGGPDCGRPAAPRQVPGPAAAGSRAGGA